MPAYTYTVVIDSRKALQDARSLRAEFNKALGEISASGGSSGSAGSSSGGLDAGAIRARLEQLTGEILEREQALFEADIKGGLPKTDARYAAQLKDHYHALEMSLGKEIADRARGSGKIANIGQVTAQFADDQLVDFERNAQRDVEFKRRQTMEERREYYAAMQEIQEKELESVRLEKQLAEQAARSELEGFDADTVNAMLQEELAEFVRRERELAEALERTNQEIADLAPKATGAQVLGGTAAGGSAARVTLSATKASVSNVEAMVEAGREYAAIVEKVADAEARAADERKRARTEDTGAYRQQEEIRRATEQRLRIEREAEAERISAIQRAEAEAREEYKRTTAEFMEQQRRQTAEYKQELRERERQARQAARNTGSATGAARAGAGAAGRALGGLGTGLLIGGLAGVGLYGADEVLRTGYQAGRTGAGQLRQAEYFERLAQQANSSADEILDAMDRASRGTIADSRAMALAITVLGREFSQETENIDEGLATLTEGARALGRVYNLETTEVFDRFVRYIGEGNKELVDQLGLSNQRIADLLGIPNEGLAGAEGAILRYQGLLLALGEDTERLGDLGLSAAEKIEQSEARISNAADRIRQALAEPTANVAEFVAGAIEGSVNQFDFDARYVGFVELVDQMQQARQEAALLEERLSNNTYEQAFKNGSISAEQYADAVSSAKEEAQEWRDRSIELRDQIKEIAIAASDSDPRIRAMADALYIATDAAIELAGGISEAVSAASGLSAVDNAMAGLGYAGRFYEDPTANPFAYAEGDEERIRYQRYAAQIGNTREREAEARRLAEEERKLAERTAKEAERAWKSAAEETARNFENALKAVPGLFSTSGVTEGDLADAEAGIYQEKADEYLRQLRDEVLNGVDYANVDIADAAQRAGVDPNLPAETILKLFERAWDDSSLFAGGANLDLINQDAVQASLDRQEKSQSGEDAIRSLFGLGDDAAGVPADFASNTINTIAGQFEAGDFSAEAAPAGEAIAGTLQGAVTNADAWTGTIEAIAGTLQAQLLAETSVDAVKQIGDTFVRLMKAGYLEGTEDVDWAGPLIDAVASQVLAAIAAEQEGEGAP